MTPSRYCCAILWPKEGAEKSFCGQFCQTKREADVSAAEEFRKDPDVKDKVRAQNEYRNRQEASKEIKRSARLAQR